MNSVDPAILGCLLGTALGDSLGLPFEGLSRQRVAAAQAKGLKHRLVLGRGMLSDDTEQTLLLASSLGVFPNDIPNLQRDFGRKLKGWLAALPAGIGLSTAQAIFKLWIGISAQNSGVRSAGNGAAMRSAIVGVLFRNSSPQRHEIARAACRVTHTAPQAEESAVLVAEAAALSAIQAETPTILQSLRLLVISNEMKERFAKLEISLKNEDTVHDYARCIGCDQGVSGFAPNTVAVALYAWLRHRDDFRMVISEVISCGGDTDSVAAIAGGICGAACTAESLPAEWITGICDWPRSVNFIRRTAEWLSFPSNARPAPPSLFWPWCVVRNAVFLAIVLFHGVRRLFP